VPAVPEAGIGAEGAEKGFLPGVLGCLARKQSAEISEDLLAVLFVETLEWRHRLRCRFQGAWVSPARPSEMTGRHVCLHATNPRSTTSIIFCNASGG
jgi:hypothetical protein